AAAAGGAAGAARAAPAAGRYVDATGQPVELPETGSGRAFTEVEHDGRRVAAIVHDASLDEEPELVRAAGAAAALALENERLDAELRVQIAEVRASRARLLEVVTRERRRIERDLHDGAQQRLVALALTLGIAENQVERDPAQAQALIREARDEARLALEELRELARGIHPAILTDRGLGPALEALASRAPLPVELSDVPRERLPSPVEGAAYFVVAEALANVAKYAQATHARVVVERSNGHAIVEVRDDGVGGADPDGGSGLRGLEDRLSAIDGRLAVFSPAGAGTTVRAEIPCTPP
ncbi:sensor histidine kinase, partial [Conexibacter stalactiti]